MVWTGSKGTKKICISLQNADFYLRNLPYRDYEIKFGDKGEFEKVDLSKFEILERNDDELSVLIRVDLKKTNDLIKEVRKHQIVGFTERKHTLEEYFVKDIEAGGK